MMYTITVIRMITRKRHVSISTIKNGHAAIKYKNTWIAALFTKLVTVLVII